MKSIRVLLTLVLAAILAGCPATTLREKGLEDKVVIRSEKLLLDALNQYEEGQFRKAAENFNGALAEGLAFKKDRVVAHKYLAFIDCAAGREAPCREQFAAALTLDPGLELTAAEAGHPLWGPVFKTVKARLTRSNK
jgi:Tfp pilus assembly protein PilF